MTPRQLAVVATAAAIFAWLMTATGWDADRPRCEAGTCQDAASGAAHGQQF